MNKTEFNHTISCRHFNEGDTAELADLIVELQSFHSLAAQSRSEITSDIKNMPAGFIVLLAEMPQSGVVGFALACTYPGPGIATGLYLKELFVTDKARSSGVGRILMQELARLAEEKGYRRIDWVTTYDNLKARNFYDGINAKSDGNKVFYRLSGDALQNLADCCSYRSRDFRRHKSTQSFP